MNSDDTVGDRANMLFAETMRLAGSAKLAALAYVAVVAGAGIWVDLSGWDTGGNLLVSIVSVAMGYYLTVTMLRDGGLLRDGLQNGFGTYFLISLLSGLGIILGIILLIIPGVVLMVRWLPAFGYGLSDGEGTTEALGKAWSETGDHFWPLLIIGLIPVGLLFAGSVIYGMTEFSEVFPLVPVVVAANIVMMSSTVAATALGLAAYSLLSDDGGKSLPEVFS